ncbi:enoyl-CoA hydratase/isomerase family protein [Pseudomaricurvus alkylphenolicus]|uniref:enoyl-CoA hydratase/isomerase family protein n=1 Tax=Pseudomaricurvus alkylphenolicus TaxID=1306991 RepID=UPI001421C742|nr:enoyl-CoA hydratase/isomerase family protein [Pseudomaricurvus alkylphenolicus]NIB43506.1 enoyl-CoA hydratase/isomerase family protein [Pseudomaricurvus alkylphenolicus]
MSVDTILDDSDIRLTLDQNVAELTINRDRRRNSLDNPALEAMIGAIEHLSALNVPVCIVASEGTRAFCAGSDLKALVDYNIRDKVRHTSLFQKAMMAVDEAPFATIAAIEGFCLGGGLELALGCDLRIASDEATFGFPEITVGALPTGGGTLRAPRAIGMARAREMLVFAEPVDAPTARDIGLISKTCSPGTARSTAREIAKDYANRVSSRSVALLKGLLHNGYATPERTTAAMAALSDQILLESEESKEKMGSALT